MTVLPNTTSSRNWSGVGLFCLAGHGLGGSGVGRWCVGFCGVRCRITCVVSLLVSLCSVAFESERNTESGQAKQNMCVFLVVLFTAL